MLKGTRTVIKLLLLESQILDLLRFCNKKPNWQKSWVCVCVCVCGGGGGGQVVRVGHSSPLGIVWLFNIFPCDLSAHSCILESQVPLKPVLRGRMQS